MKIFNRKSAELQKSTPKLSQEEIKDKLRKMNRSRCHMIKQAAKQIDPDDLEMKTIDRKTLKRYVPLSDAKLKELEMIREQQIFKFTEKNNSI